MDKEALAKLTILSKDCSPWPLCPIQSKPSQMALRFSPCTASYSSSALTSSHNFCLPTLSLHSFSKNPSPLSLHTLTFGRLHAVGNRFRDRAQASSTAMATGVQEVLPPALDSTSEPPAIFDGTTRLYICYTCPYAQRVWITRNCKGLQEEIKLVPIDLQNRPTWYKEKVYPPNKVPSLEHNNEVKGESLDLIRYIDSNFDGPSLFPDDPAKKEFGGELLSYTDKFNGSVMGSLKTDGTSDADAAFDHIEAALSKFDDGPFFLGQFSLVDIAYAPFIERYQPLLLDVKKYDVSAGRPKLAAWIVEMNKIEAYKQTRRDPKELVDGLKKRFLAQL